MTKLSPDRLWTIHQLIYSEALEELQRIFKHLGIRFMPIKGAYLIVAGLAPQISRREMVDIDILVLEEDYSRAIESLSATTGWHLKINNPLHHHVSFSLDFGGVPPTSISIEVHRAVANRFKYRLTAEELFSRASEIRGYMVVPSREDALLIELLHTLNHAGLVLSAKALDTLTIMMRIPEFDWTQFWMSARATHCLAWTYYMVRLFEKSRAVQVPGSKEIGKTSRILYAEFLASKYSIEQINQKSNLWRRIALEAVFLMNPVGSWLLSSEKRARSPEWRRKSTWRRNSNVQAPNSKHKRPDSKHDS